MAATDTLMRRVASSHYERNRVKVMVGTRVSRPDKARLEQRARDQLGESGTVSGFLALLIERELATDPRDGHALYWQEATKNTRNHEHQWSSPLNGHVFCLVEGCEAVERV